MATRRGYPAGRRRPTAALVAAVALTLLAPAAAQGSTLRLVPCVAPNCTGPEYDAAPGERNDLRVSRADPAMLIAEDRGAAIAAPAGCAGAGTARVTCPVVGLKSMDVTLGDGDDRADFSAAGDLGATLKGGDGRDTLIGGHGVDDLDGGPADDLLDGGAGDVDSVEYGDRERGLRADLARGVVAIGAERDRIRHVEFFYGTHHADVIDGSAGDDDITGGGGDDRLRGGRGNDSLAGNGVLEGGPGGDEVAVGSGRGACGSGDDRAGVGPRGVLDSDCEMLFDRAGTLRLVDRHADRVHFVYYTPGPGFVRARVSTPSGRVLGERRVRARRGCDDCQAFGDLRLSRAGAAYVRRARPRVIVVRVRPLRAREAIVAHIRLPRVRAGGRRR